MNAMPPSPFDQGLQQAGRLASAVCARVCHDIAGPLGALGGTLELALAGDEEAAALALELCALMTARLRLLREAWGGGAMEAVTGAAWAALLPGLPGAERLRLDLAAIDERRLPAAIGRLVPALLLVAASSLPRGGTISLSGGEAGLVLCIEGAKAGWPADLEASVGSPEATLAATSPEATLAAIGPRSVAAPLALLEVLRLGLCLRRLSATSLRVTVS